MSELAGVNGRQFWEYPMVKHFVTLIAVSHGGGTSHEQDPVVKPKSIACKAPGLLSGLST